MASMRMGVGPGGWEGRLSRSAHSGDSWQQEESVELPQAPSSPERQGWPGWKGRAGGQLRQGRAWSLSPQHWRACRTARGSCNPGKRQVMTVVHNEAAPIMSMGLLSDHRLDTSENKLF